MLSRIIHQAKAFLMNASRGHREVVQRMESIIRRLSQIEGKETQMIEELRNHMEASVKSAVHELSEYLKSDDVKARVLPQMVTSIFQNQLILKKD